MRVQKVQKVQKVQRGLVGGCAASLYKTFIIALAGEEKPYNRAYGARKCTPSAYGTSPRESMSLDSQSLPAPYESSSFATPEGEVLAALCFEMLMSSKAGHRANFPLRGKSP